MVNFLKILYKPTYMVKDSLKLGELPSTKVGYSIAYATAWAAIVEFFLVALVGAANTLMVSAVGEHAIAAVSVTVQPRYLAQTAIFALNMAIAAICARRKGENNQWDAVNVMKQGIMLSIILSVSISLVFYQFTESFVRFMGAEEAIVATATEFFQILLIGLPFSNVSLTISAAQRGIGETKASMHINMTANAINVIFNFLLINGIWLFPRLEVKGAAIATVMGWIIGLIVAVMSITGRNQFLNVRGTGKWKFDKTTINTIKKIGAGAFFEQIFLRFGYMLNARIVIGLGTMMLAAHEILMNMMSLSYSFGDGFGAAAASLVGQNFGAKRPDLSIVYGKICQRMCLISSGVLSFVFLVFGLDIVKVFSKDPSIVAVSRYALIIMSLIIFFQSTQIVFMDALRGAGDTKCTAMVSLISIMVVRPIIGYFFAYVVGMGLIGVWIAISVDQFVRVFLTHRRFSSGDWRKIKV